MRTKMIFLTVALCLSCAAAWAQSPFGIKEEQTKQKAVSLSLGVGGGVQMSGLLGVAANDVNLEMKMGYHAGVLAQLRFLPRDSRSGPETGWIAIQPEARYSVMGGALPGLNVNMDYLTIPVMFQVYPIKNLYIEVGPVFAINLNSSPSSFTYEGYIYDMKDFRPRDVMLAAGVGYSTNFGLSVGIRYHYGLVLMDSAQMRSRNHCIQAGLAYSFRLGGRKHSNRSFDF